MKIVVLDGYTLNPGDLSWAELEALGECSIYDRTPAAETLTRAQGAEAVFTNKTELSRETIEQLPDLKFIGILATGYNVVDVDAARERGIPVANIPTYGTRSVAQMVFAHLLNLTQGVAAHAQGVNEGKWCKAEDFCYYDAPLTELDGMALGIIGFGNIGQAVANVAPGFGLRVFAYDPRVIPAMRGVRYADLDDIFTDCDVISLHCPLTASNRGFINAERLAMMKPTAFLINTSRGPLIDEPALAAALNEGRLAGAGLDVLATEPPSPDNPLLSAKNCFITPHIAWATKEARTRLLHSAVRNLKGFLSGEPRNVVNP